MILHTVNKTGQALDLGLRFATQSDVILLLEDGVYAALDGSAQQERLQTACADRILAIREDLVARGVEAKLSEAIEPIDYDAFVALCCRCDKVQSWF